LLELKFIFTEPGRGPDGEEGMRVLSECDGKC